MNKQRKVSLVGSFRKDPEMLRTVFNELKAHYQVLSPIDIDFIDSESDFAKAKHEVNLSVNTIEESHLTAIQNSEFIWLFTPEGHLGTSAAFEIGFAHALGVPIYTDIEPNDEMLKTMITSIANIEDIPEVVHKPGKGVGGLQAYYKRFAEERGWAEESARDTMLLLTEEIGELARAIRKTAGLKRDAGYDGISLLDELADVQLYLVHLANVLDVSLSDAITQKMNKNHNRHNRKISS